MQQENTPEKRRRARRSKNARVREVVTSQYWCNTQRKMNLSGHVNPVGSHGKEGGLKFNVEDVRYLYQLYLVINEITPLFNKDMALEVVEQRNKLLNWPFCYMIVPASVRRKVYGFMQSHGLLKSHSRKAGKFNLYLELQEASKNHSVPDKMDGDSCLDELDKKIETFPLKFSELKLIDYGNFEPGAYRRLSKSDTPIFSLFLLEIHRLKYNKEFSKLLRLEREVNNADLLEKLGVALFFTFIVWNNDSGLFMSFISALPSGNRGALLSELEWEIKRFIVDVNERFLLSANKRVKIKKDKETRW